MAYAIDTYPGDGSTVDFTVTFPYILQSHVKVYLDGVLQVLTTDYTWFSSTVIRMNTAPTGSETLKFVRASSPTAKLVDFNDGSSLTEANADRAFDQMFYMAQEAVDAVAGIITLATDDKWDGQSKVMKNIADPSSAQDVVTKAYGDANYGASAATAAAASAAAAAASYDSFDDRYLGPKASAPTLDNDGNALVTGALYFNTALNAMKVWNGSAWQDLFGTSLALSGTLDVTGVSNFASRIKVGSSVASTGSALLDVVGSGSLAQLVLANTVTDATQKQGILAVRHYTAAEENQFVIGGVAGVSTNSVYIGGGFGTENASNSIGFYTASSSTALSNTATLRMQIGSAGTISFGDTVSAPSSSQFFMGGNTASGVSRGLYIAPTVTLSATAFGEMLRIGGTFVEASSDNHPLLAGVRIDVMGVTGGAATVTDTASLYIAGAASATVTGSNYAMWVASGLSRFSGDVLINGTLRVGTYTTLGAETLAGFITIQDSGGTSRKVAVVA